MGVMAAEEEVFFETCNREESKVSEFKFLLYIEYISVETFIKALTTWKYTECEVQHWDMKQLIITREDYNTLTKQVCQRFKNYFSQEDKHKILNEILKTQWDIEFINLEGIQDFFEEPHYQEIIKNKIEQLKIH